MKTTTTQMLSELPHDFDWRVYLDLNSDIAKIGLNTERQSILHYLHYGRHEKRIYKLEPEQQSIFRNDRRPEKRPETDLLVRYEELFKTIPEDFDCRLYRLYNPDLTHMSNQELALHYVKYGQKEARVYYSGVSYEELVSQQKNISFKNINYRDPVILINHDISLTGAPIFLYDLYDHIVENNRFQNVHIVEPFPNNILPSHPSKLYHYNDVNLLKKLFEVIDPALIYSNSLNLYLFNFDAFESFHYKTIIHFHEVYEDAMNDLTLNNNIEKCPIYCVSEKIKEQFLSKKPNLNIDIFPPFIPEKKQKYILEQKNIKVKFSMPKDKTRIGMCGDLNDRKNFDLFYRLAVENTEYNFLWVGGKDIKLTLKGKKQPNNLYWIPHVDNPYPYLNMMDYFFLTSKRDPCPIVVLEALLLNKKIIVIKNNIYTQHDKSLLEGYYELEGDSEDQICQNFSNLKLTKALYHNATDRNTEYIKNNYTEPAIFQDSCKMEKSKNYVILSLYSKYGDVQDIDYYCNLINQFILRHSDFYYFIPIIVVSSNFNEVFGDNLKQYLLERIKNLKESGHVLFKENKGYDIGGLLKGLNFIYGNNRTTTDAFDRPDTKIAYIHNKNNKSWRNALHKIFYSKDIQDYDTTTPAKWTAICSIDDLNRKIMKAHPLIFDLDTEDTPFHYVAGTCFITNLKYLKPLAEKYSYIEPLLTDKDKDDTFWQHYMCDKSVFDQYVHMHSHDMYNSKIDINSYYIMQNHKCKNYIEMYDKFNMKGIPDLQIEHALERYIGYLTIDKGSCNRIM